MHRSQNMPDSSIKQELSLGEVISQTFQLYRRNFWKYVTIFLVVEAIFGVLNGLVNNYIVLPARLAPGATPQQVLNWTFTYLGAALLLALALFLVSVILSPIALGSTIRMTSDVIENRPPDLMAGVRFIFSKLLSVWAVSIIIGIVVTLGFIALIVPGIILGIMFSLALTALLIENKGVFDSLGRSRKLVGNRWLKSFALYLVIGILIGIAAEIVVLITAPISVPVIRYLVEALISAFYLPIIPILVTVYYYSNTARTAPAPPPPPPSPLPPTSATRFCPSCGEPVTEANQAFCRKCGADLRPHQT